MSPGRVTNSTEVKSEEVSGLGQMEPRQEEEEIISEELRQQISTFGRILELIQA